MKIIFVSVLYYIFGLKKSPRLTSAELMTSLFDNGLLRKAIVHPTQFLGFEFISPENFLLFSNEHFQSTSIRNRIGLQLGWILLLD